MKQKIDELSVFFPAFNEEKNIKKTVIDAKKVLERVVGKWEIVVVDDGSSDKTAEIVKELANKNSKIKLISHKKNMGYGGALKTGFKNARYEWIAFSDSDGQFDFGEITKFIEKTDSADLILGYRLKRADSFTRKVFTWGWNLFPRVILGMRAKDYSCGFKLIKRKVFKAVQPLVGEEKVTQIEMLVKARRMGFKFSEIGIHHYPRKEGKATGASVKVVLKSIKDLLVLWKKLR